MSVSFKEKKVRNTGSLIAYYHELSNRKKVKVNENPLLDASIPRKKFSHCFQIENIDMAIKFNSQTKQYNLLAFGKDVEVFPVIQYPQYEKAQIYYMNQQMLINQQQQQQLQKQQQQQQYQYLQQPQQYSQLQLRNQNQSNIQSQIAQPPVFGVPIGKDSLISINQFNSAPPPQIQPQMIKQISQNQNQEQSKERITKYIETQIVQASQILQSFKELIEHCRDNKDVIESKELQEFKIAVDHNYKVFVSCTEHELEEKQMERVLRYLDDSHNITERYRRICSFQEIIPSKIKPNINQRQELLIQNDYQNQQQQIKAVKLDNVKQVAESEDIQLIQLDNNSDEDYDDDDYGYSNNNNQQNNQSNLNENYKEMKSKQPEQQQRYPIIETTLKNKGEINYNQGENIKSQINNNQNNTQQLQKSIKNQQQLASSEQFNFIQIENNNINNSNKSNREMLFENKDTIQDALHEKHEKDKQVVSLSMLENKMNKLKALKDSQWGKQAHQVGWKEEFPDVGNKPPRKAYPNPNNILKSPGVIKQNDIKDNNNNQKKSQLSSELLDEQLCIICLQNESTFALVPCGHKKYCESCADEILKKQVCAFCMKPATQKMRIFS